MCLWLSCRFWEAAMRKGLLSEIVQWIAEGRYVVGGRKVISYCWKLKLARQNLPLHGMIVDPYQHEEWFLCCYPSLRVQEVEISREDEDREKKWVSAWSTKLAVFSNDGSSHVDNLAYNATRCAIYSTHERLCLTMGEYKVTCSSSSATIAMTSSCTNHCSETMIWFSKQFCTKIY